MSESNKQLISLEQTKVRERLAMIREAMAKKNEDEGPTEKSVDPSMKTVVRGVVRDVRMNPKFNSIKIFVTSPTGEYPYSTNISTIKEKKLMAEIDKEHDLIKLYATESDNYTVNKNKVLTESPQNVVLKSALDPVFLIEKETILNLSYKTNDIAKVSIGDEVLIAIRRSFYLKEEGGKWNHGISMAGEGIIVKKRTSPLRLYKKARESPEVLISNQLKLQDTDGVVISRIVDPLTLLEFEGYDKNNRPKGSNDKYVKSGCTVKVPVNWPSFNPPSMGIFASTDKKYYYVTKDKQQARKFGAMFQIQEWLNESQMFELGDKAETVTTTFEFCEFETNNFKVHGIDFCEKFNLKLRGEVPMVLDFTILLQKTAMNPTNDIASEDYTPNRRYYEAEAPNILCDFPTFLRERGLPMCREAVLKLLEDDDPRMQSWCTPNLANKAEEGMARRREQRDQCQDKDTSYYNLNEWTPDSRFKTLKACQHFEFYAIPLPGFNPQQEQMLFETLPEWRRKNPDYKGPIADMLMFREWNGNAEEYCKMIECKQAIPADHPLLKERHIVPVVTAGMPDLRFFLLYAVDPKAYAEALEVRKEPAHLTAPPTQLTITAPPTAETDMKVDEPVSPSHKNKRKADDELSIKEEGTKNQDEHANSRPRIEETSSQSDDSNISH